MKLNTIYTLILLRAPVPPLASKSVEGAALPLEGVHHVHGSDSLPLGVLGVSHSVADNVLKEHLQKVKEDSYFLKDFSV